MIKEITKNLGKTRINIYATSDNIYVIKITHFYGKKIININKEEFYLLLEGMKDFEKAEKRDEKV